MFAAEKVMPFILDKNGSIRSFAVQYFTDGYVEKVDKLEIMQLILQSCQMYPMQERDNRHNLYLAKYLPQSEETIKIIMRLLKQQKEPMNHRYGSILERANPKLLKPYLSEMRGYISREMMDNIYLRVRFLEQDSQQLWQELLQYGDEAEGKYVNEFNYSHGEYLAWELAGRADISSAKILEQFNHYQSSDYFGYTNIYLAQCLGQRRIEEAVPLLVEMLASEGDLDIEVATKALVDMGSATGVELVKERFMQEDFFFQSAASDLFTRIKSKQSEQAILQLLQQELDPTINAFLCNGLCELLSIESIPVVEQAIQSENYDHSAFDIEGQLKIMAAITGVKLGNRVTQLASKQKKKKISPAREQLESKEMYQEQELENLDEEELLAQKMYEELHLALEREKKRMERLDEKLWSEISIPLTLGEALSKLTKNELQTIRHFLEVKKASSLNKADLIAVLQQHIVEKVQMVYGLLDEERYHFIRKIVANEGMLYSSDITREQAQYYRSLGIIFSGTYQGKKIMVMPQEVLQAFKRVEENFQGRAIMKRNTEWIKLTQGLLYYYGALHLEEVMELVEKYEHNGFIIESRAYLEVIEHASLYYGKIISELGWYCLAEVLSPERVLREHQRRASLSFYPFTKRQLLRAGEPGYIEKNESYHSFVLFLTEHFEISRVEVERLVDELIFHIKCEKPLQEIFADLQEMFELVSMEALKAMMEELVSLVNNTRAWFLKGYTPEELMEKEKGQFQPLPALALSQPTQKEAPNSKVIDISSKRKVGRNEPCSCGSGKKYKKCCGR